MAYALYYATSPAPSKVDKETLQRLVAVHFSTEQDAFHAAAHGVQVSPHVVHEISLHVVGALQNGFLVEYMDWAPPDLFEALPECRGGRFRIPDQPGHGMSLARGAIDKYRTR